MSPARPALPGVDPRGDRDHPIPPGQTGYTKTEHEWKSNLNHPGALPEPTSGVPATGPVTRDQVDWVRIDEDFEDTSLLAHAAFLADPGSIQMTFP